MAFQDCGSKRLKKKATFICTKPITKLWEIKPLLRAKYLLSRMITQHKCYNMEGGKNYLTMDLNA